MATLTIELPDTLAEEAREAGLLTSEALEQLLKDAMRQQAGSQLLEAAKKIKAADVPPISDADIVAEVKAVRAELRARQGKVDSAGRS